MIYRRKQQIYLFRKHKKSNMASIRQLEVDYYLLKTKEAIKKQAI